MSKTTQTLWPKWSPSITNWDAFREQMQKAALEYAQSLDPTATEVNIIDSAHRRCCSNGVIDQANYPATWIFPQKLVEA